MRSLLESIAGTISAAAPATTTSSAVAAIASVRRDGGGATSTSRGGVQTFSQAPTVAGSDAFRLVSPPVVIRR